MIMKSWSCSFVVPDPGTTIMAIPIPNHSSEMLIHALKFMCFHYFYLGWVCKKIWPEISQLLWRLFQHKLPSSQAGHGCYPRFCCWSHGELGSNHLQVVDTLCNGNVIIISFIFIFFCSSLTLLINRSRYSIMFIS